MDKTEKEKALLAGLAQNDTGSIEIIYREHFQMVKQMVVSNNGSADDASDLFQEAMIVLYEKAGTVDFELNCQLKTFIYSICKRLWLKRLKKQGRFVYIDHMEDTVLVEEETEEHEKSQADFSLMEDALKKLGEPCKSLIEAYYIQKKQMQEIATDFGYTNADNAKTQKYKCLVRLKKLFFAQYKNT